MAEFGGQISFSPYAFAHNNPISLSDPSGLCPDCGGGDNDYNPQYPNTSGEQQLDEVILGSNLDEVVVAGKSDSNFAEADDDTDYWGYFDSEFDGPKLDDDNGYYSKAEHSYYNSKLEGRISSSVLEYNVNSEMITIGTYKGDASIAVFKFETEAKYGVSTLEGKAEVLSLKGNIQWGPLTSETGKIGWIGSLGGSASVVEYEGQFITTINTGLFYINPSIIYGGAAATVNLGASFGVYYDIKNGTLNIQGLQHTGLGLGQKFGAGIGIGLGSRFN